MARSPHDCVPLDTTRTVVLVSWRIHYADGAGNTYTFDPDGTGARFTYDPVTPERSSSGMYSGGPPRAGHLAPDTLASLWTHVHALAAATALHRDDRAKGTGMVHVVEGSAERRFVIARGEELAAFDVFVAAL